MEESEKRFGLCQSQHLAFCRSGGDCVDRVAQARVMHSVSELLQDVRISVICLLVSVCEGFHNPWIYTGAVFTLTLTRISQGRGEALSICLFSKNKVNKANKSS